MRIGLLGFGFMGGAHLAAIERIEGVTLTAVASRTRPVAGAPSRGNLDIKAADLPDHAKWYSDWRQLILDPEVDAVDICLPTHLHQEAVLAALERGKHVLCEKPMALTQADCDVMLEASNKTDRIFMVGQILRFMFPYRYAASFVGAGVHGPITACTMSRKTGYPQWSEWLSKEKQSGGAILDLLSHDIDQALKLFGQPDFVSAVSQGEVDTMRGRLYYDSGLEVKIEGGWFAPEVPFSAAFLITDKDAALSFRDGKLTHHLVDGEHSIDQPEDDPYLEELSYFIECCRTNAAPELCLPTESAQAVRVSNLLKVSREDNGREVACEI